MLKEKRRLFEVLFVIGDLITVSLAWCVAFWVRFESGWFLLDKGRPDFTDYISVLLLVVPVWGLVFRAVGLYKPMRGVREWRERMLLLYGNGIALVLLITLIFLFREKTTPFSRAVFLWFGLFTVVFTLVERGLLRNLLRDVRRKGFNLRYMLIVGDGRVASDVVRRIRGQRELGIQLLGCVTKSGEPESGPEGAPVVEGYAGLGKLLRSLEVDQVLVALPLEDSLYLPQIMKEVAETIVDVKIVPDLYQFVRVGGTIEEFDGLPVIGIQGSSLEGLGRIIKRILDVMMALLLFVALLPFLLLLALAIKCTSRGPIFYVQERVSIDGTRFSIYKFRTMVVSAERNGPGWTKPSDARITRLGRFLRKTSLDELPQLINVLRGDMSIVGPRPERPVYIQEFRTRIPGYMLRHKVPAGITGWAQVHGWRGDTSIDKRIEFDLQYIENWSLWLDFKILLLTLLRGFRNKNAY
jgi:Undecaprenyl-phosphate glucose phosphotransferase